MFQFTRKRRVRLHFLDDAPSIEGIQIGCFGGHYVIEQPELKRGENSTVALSGHVRVPRERVFFVQVNP